LTLKGAMCVGCRRNFKSSKSEKECKVSLGNTKVFLFFYYYFFSYKVFLPPRPFRGSIHWV